MEKRRIATTMSLIHIHSSENSIDDLIDAVEQTVDTKEGPVIIAISGGSASGKTTIGETLASYFSDKSLLLSQDLFQLGKEFAYRKTSPYKWDDPLNFALDECVSSLSLLRSGKSAVVPAFDVVENRRKGTVSIESKPIIFWEGIYAVGSQELREMADLALYVDTPYLIRLLRRIRRFISQRDTDEAHDYATPARQMLTFVLRAENEIALSQRDSADIVIPFNASLTQSEIDEFIAATTGLPLMYRSFDMTKPVLHEVTWGGLRFILFEDGFAVIQQQKYLYFAPLTHDEVAEAVLSFQTLTH